MHIQDDGVELCLESSATLIYYLSVQDMTCKSNTERHKKNKVDIQAAQSSNTILGTQAVLRSQCNTWRTEQWHDDCSSRKAQDFSKAFLVVSSYSTEHMYWSSKSSFGEIPSLLGARFDNNCSQLIIRVRGCWYGVLLSNRVEKNRSTRTRTRYE